MESLGRFGTHLPLGPKKTDGGSQGWLPRGPRSSKLWRDDQGHHGLGENFMNKTTKALGLLYIICSNYSDLTRPHPKWWFSKDLGPSTLPEG